MLKLPRKLTTTMIVLMLAAPTASFAKCYNPNEDRDKWLAGWLDWVPEKGEKAERDGKTYSRSKAIKYVKAEVAKAYTDRDANAQESPAAQSLFAVLDANGINTNAVKKYARSKQKVTFDDAIVCWHRYLKN